MTVIDLGELRDDPLPPPSGPAPRAVGRPLRLAVVLALTLLASNAAAPVAERVTAVVPALLGTVALLADGEVFLLEPSGTAAAPGWLSAWTVPTSAGARPVRRWQVPVPVVSGSAQLRRHADLLLLTGSSGRPDGAYRTFAHARDTGRVRWQRLGAGRPAGPDLLFEDGADGPPTVHSVDPGTGRDRWSVPMPSPVTLYRNRADGVDRIVTVRPDGPAEVWDARHGVRLHTAPLDRAGSPSNTGFDVVGDLLLTIQGNSGRLTGYGLDGLDRRWEVPLPTPSFFVACGSLICAQGTAGGVRALDPATGRTVWRDNRWELSGTERGGRMLASGLGRGVWHPLVVLDVASGRVAAELDVWNVAASHSPDGPVFGVRPAGEDRMLVAELDVAAARARVRDVLPAVSGDCQAGAQLLLCRLVDGAFGVWRVPR
ncbi:PQQ-binding-like beta-propeller repeat protein [Micromonospora sp. HUAS LYJ1]|uniref:outer membrane protein assembly factor BamB family protein n=1 Tax=Micromonospora sp. HUAS LYJ1 TaxID=3061626 RepID=UPI0026723B58|nr:PQQ-binding-like beta-propeller repeat protein [Micromonospora sp. HUAS LYJ1]WKU04831.1 PQQ-binding-like beta-propeller repeat protein [Micromonospora sp. HUAS LYJ1]